MQNFLCLFGLFSRRESCEAVVSTQFTQELNWRFSFSQFDASFFLQEWNYEVDFSFIAFSTDI